MTEKDLVKNLQGMMNALGEKLTVDGVLGPKTAAALDKYEMTVVLKKKEPAPPPTPKPEEERKSPPWYLFALRFKGKKETDADFAAYMVPQWSLVGLKLKTIATSWSAWCGLAMAVALSGVGIDHARNGALARNWAKYGVEIDWKKDGIPQGAIIHINHTQCGSSSGNHVAQANGDCTAEDLLKTGATIDLYGGNQGNTWKVSTYQAKSICAVRWPKDVKDYPKPGPVLKSVKCTSKGASDTTR